MSDETTQAIEAANHELDWAMALVVDGLPIGEAIERLRPRSRVAAEAVELAVADIRELGIDATDLGALRKIAGCYADDVARGVIRAWL